MRWKLIILSFIFCSYGYSQATTLTILGRTSYTTYPQSYIYKISNGEPGHSAAEFDSLKYLLDSQGVTFRMDSTIHSRGNSKPWVSIDFYTYTLPHFELLKAYSSQMDMYGEEYFEYTNKDFVYQDALALLAYQDALKRAKIMAQYLGKNISRVRNIDDKVEKYLFYPDLFTEARYDADQLKELLCFMEFLSALEPEKQLPERRAQYALWVTFEVK